MARVKPKRHGVSLDMTAMCDVAFLLLTFFILTTKFKEPDPVAIKPPTSISETVLNTDDVMIVNIDKEGKFYFMPINTPAHRKALLSAMSSKIGQVTPEQTAAFLKAPSISVPHTQVKGLLSKSDEDLKNYIGPGIPQDSANRQVIDWVEQALIIRPEAQLAVKGDGATKYDRVKYLFEGLKDIKKNNFLLITQQEGK